MPEFHRILGKVKMDAEIVAFSSANQTVTLNIDGKTLNCFLPEATSKAKEDEFNQSIGETKSVSLFLLTLDCQNAKGSTKRIIDQGKAIIR